MTSRKAWIKTGLYVAPVAIVSSAFVTMSTVDDWIHNNRDQVQEIELNQSSYLSSILSLDNPWNIVDPDDPASFLLSFFIGADANIIAKLKELISVLDMEKLVFLTDLLKTVELSDEQRDRFIVLMSTILQGKDGIKKIPHLIGLLERIEQAEKDFIALAKLDPEALAQQSVGVQKPGEEGLVTPMESLNLSLIQILTTDKPESLTFLLDTMLSLPPHVYEQLMALIGKLGGSRTEKLLALLEDLPSYQVQSIISLLSEVDTKTLRRIVDRLDTIPGSMIGELLLLTNSLVPSDIETIFELTDNYSQSDFSTFVDIHKDVKNVGLALEVYDSLSDGAAKSLILNIFEVYSSTPSDLNFMITELAALPNNSRNNFVQAFKNISTDSIDTLPFLFKKLSTNTDKRRLVDEASILNLGNRENIVEVLYEIDGTRASKVLDIASNLNGSGVKNMLADQSHRILNFSLGSADSGERVTNNYSAPRTVHNDNGEDVLEGLVDQLYDVNDSSLNETLISGSDDLSDLSLYRGAEVVKDIDINDTALLKPSAGALSKASAGDVRSKTRVRSSRLHRFVSIHQRLDKKEKATAIDTIHDIDSRDHRKAAIDMGFYADDALLKDSISYTENLRGQLGDEEGLEASKRLITVASRVNEDSLSKYDAIRGSEEEAFSSVNEARQAGLDALQNERESRVNKILKQTTKENDPHGYKTFDDGKQILRITSLYRRLDSEEPKINPFHRTRAAELADALSSSEGMTIGPSNETGNTRYVSQETKLRRIDEYLELDYDVLMEDRVYPLTDRPLLVTHRKENNFSIPDPERIRRDSNSYSGKPKVTLVKPNSQKEGL